MIRLRLVTLLACMFVVTGLAWAQSGDDEAALKKRFEQRYLTLLRLKDQGKVGETFSGFAEAVAPRYLAEPIDAGDKESSTIQKFLSEENSDRRRLYLLIAKKTSTKEELVARRNAQRLFSKARPSHYLRLSDGRWVQQKDLREEARKGASRPTP